MTVSHPKFITGQVIENRAWTDQLFSLKINADQMHFKAGQFIRLQRTINGEVVTKPYSLVNAPDEPVIEVFYNKVTDGRLSNELANLMAGDAIDVSRQANGLFVLDAVPASKHLWMIATGTGIGPYISILKTSEAWDRFEKIVLVHGVSLLEQLVFSELIETWQQNHPGKFQFVSCVTREQNPSGLDGRVTDLLTRGTLENQTGLEISKETSHVMLCGNHNMINDMKTILAERDMSRHQRNKPGQITTEQYF